MVWYSLFDIIVSLIFQKSLAVWETQEFFSVFQQNPTSVWGEEKIGNYGDEMKKNNLEDAILDIAFDVSGEISKKAQNNNVRSVCKHF